MGYHYSQLAHDEVWVDEHDDDDSFVCAECGAFVEHDEGFQSEHWGDDDLICEDCYDKESGKD